jgi:GcrA cell cycle regulator
MGSNLAHGWTDERIAILEKLWLAGHSGSQIAKALGGITRNAVIGRAYRMGLSGREKPSSPGFPIREPLLSFWTGDRTKSLAEMWPTTMGAAQIALALGGGISTDAVKQKALRMGLVRPAHVRHRLLSEAGKGGGRRPRIAPPLKPPRPADPVLETGANAVGILALTRSNCRYPVGEAQGADQMFCGNPAVPSGPYCPKCALLAFTGERVVGKGYSRYVGRLAA